MAAWRFSHTLVLLLALVVVLSSSVDASKWARKSGDINTPVWRRSSEYGTFSPTNAHNSVPAEAALAAHRRELAGEDEFGPAFFDNVLSLDSKLEGMSQSELESRISFASLKSLSISENVNVYLFQNVLNKVMAISNLEEVEILQSNIDLDFSRQASLKRVAIDSAMLASLPELSQLEELAVTNMDDEAVEQVERFSHVSRLTLSGSYEAIGKVDSALFANLKAMNIEIKSIQMQVEDQTEQITKDSPKTFTSAKRSSQSSNFYQSSTASLSTTIYTNSSWTNETLNNAICNLHNVDMLQLYGVYGSSKMFTLPACISNWTTLTWVQCMYCSMPNFTNLPPTLSTLWIQFMQGGSYTQAQNGLVGPDSPVANYFDWSWLPNMPQLSTLYFISCGINGTMPNQYNSSKLTSLDISGQAGPRNTFAGTIAADWFLKYPKMNGVNWGYNQLTGTFPYYGLGVVENLQISNNKFTHWPPFITNATQGFGPMDKLSYLDLGSNDLRQIPSEQDFLAMKKLGWFYIGSNRNLNTPFPNVLKSNSNSQLTIIDANACNFTGPLPEIPEENLHLYTSASNSFLFSGNSFVGPIPASWSGLSFTWLYLAGNKGLNGTLAQISPINGSIIASFVKDVRLLQLDGTGFTGPMFNVSTFASVQNIMVQTPNVDFCAVPRAYLADNPSIDPNGNLTVLFPFVPNSCTFTLTNASHCAWAYPSKCKVDVLLPPPSVPSSIPAPTPGMGPQSPSAPTAAASTLGHNAWLSFILMILVVSICISWMQ